MNAKAHTEPLSSFSVDSDALSLSLSIHYDSVRFTMIYTKHQINHRLRKRHKDLSLILPYPEHGGVLLGAL